MMYAIVTKPDSRGTETDNMWVLLNRSEREIIHEAVKEYAARNKRRRGAQVLRDQIGYTPNF